ncbi:3-oxoacyl-ACP reductase FabG [Actinomadura xylanilytica]|uniref:3-oxoacyl-ACP reductase FabG n=1 Tax=Actinomadura xylanilytica TaxID=887459 RepID=UPI00255A7A9F|nr:3-oxoacyl-ACP reductase FabG [Actinomadura xylanilytica]MDL4773068.1 3-oxoacyl-ACP reductase FabG [Actinomadura xylanilytica]
MDRFTGKIAVITGAARGIGAATAERLAGEGARVVLLDLHGAADTAARIGPAATSIACDVTDQAAVEAAFAGLDAIDVLVNNAGITRDNLLFKLPKADWDAVLAVNLTGAFHCCQAAQRQMVRQRSGKIVSLSSRSALGNRGQANYAAAKAGIQALTATLAIELGPYGINVNAVAPGYIATEMTAATATRVGATPEEHQRSAAGRTPLGRVGRPEEVAAAIAFLASDDASYVSGQTLYINGGAR